MWLSLVERCVRDAEVAGSNPVTSTKDVRIPCFKGFFFVVQRIEEHTFVLPGVTFLILRERRFSYMRAKRKRIDKLMESVRLFFWKFFLMIGKATDIVHIYIV